MASNTDVVKKLYYNITAAAILAFEKFEIFTMCPL